MLADVLQPPRSAGRRFDTRNPPRAIGTGGIFDYLRAQLPGFRIERDRPRRRRGVAAGRARRADARVQRAPRHRAGVAGWTADPLRAAGDRRPRHRPRRLRHQGRGGVPARRGASARTGDAAFLFTSDEEANDARCIAAFLARDHGFTEAIVAEPTRCAGGARASRHRFGAAWRSRARPAMPRRANALDASAVHQAMRWGDAALDLVAVAVAPALRRADRPALQHRPRRRRHQGQHDRAERGGALRLPAAAVAGHRRAARDASAACADPACAGRLRGNLPRPVAAGRATSRRPKSAACAARDLADELGLPIGNAVDFWTEASLFSAGRPDRAGLRPRRHRPGAHRRRMGRARTAAARRRHHQPHHGTESHEPASNDPWQRCTTTQNPRSTIVRLLSNMASAKEIQQYLKRFSQLDAARFAVVKVGGAILRDDLDALVSSLAFLQQVGLTPIVIHGAGPQLDEELAGRRHREADRRRPARDHAARCWRSCAGCSSRRTCTWSRRCRRRACARPRSSPACSRPITSTATSTGWSAKVKRGATSRRSRPAIRSGRSR